VTNTRKLLPKVAAESCSAKLCSKASPPQTWSQNCNFSKLLFKVSVQSCSPILFHKVAPQKCPRKWFPEATSQSCFQKHRHKTVVPKLLYFKPILQSGSRKVLRKVAPESYPPKLRFKASPQSYSPKWFFNNKIAAQSRSPKLLSRAAPNSCSPKLLKLPPKFVTKKQLPKIIF